VFPLYDYSVIFPKGTGEREKGKKDAKGEPDEIE